MVVGTDAIFCGRSTLFPRYEREYHALCAVGHIQWRDGTLHESHYLPVGAETALEPVRGCVAHQAMVGAGHAGGDGGGDVWRCSRGGRLCFPEGGRHLDDSRGRGYCATVLHHHGVCLSYPRYSRRWLLHACPLGAPTVGVCGIALHLLQDCEHLLPIGFAADSGLAATLHHGRCLVDLCAAGLQRTAGGVGGVACVGNESRRRRYSEYSDNSVKRCCYFQGSGRDICEFLPQAADSLGALLHAGLSPAGGIVAQTLQSVLSCCPFRGGTGTKRRHGGRDLRDRRGVDVGGRYRRRTDSEPLGHKKDLHPVGALADLALFRLCLSRRLPTDIFLVDSALHRH